MIDATAVVLFFGVTAYALFGGADFGAGIWDLVAGGTDRGERPRALIDHSIGPVWEANHVWLIFCLVVLWTAFSEAFASIMLTLFVPLTLAALGIVLRGSSFAFRKAVVRTRDRRNFGAAFALSSVHCSVLHGRGRGRDRVRDAFRRVGKPAIRGRVGSTPPRSSAACSRSRCARTSPPSISSGTHIGCGDSDLSEYFRRRAIVAAVVAGVIAFVGIFVFHSDSKYLFDGLTSRALPLVIISGVCGVVSLAHAAARTPRRGRGCSRSVRSRQW